MTDIRQWLEELGLGQFADAFEAEQVSIANLPDLTDGELKDIGLPLGPRKTVIKAARTLGAATDSAETLEIDIAHSSREAERRQITVMFCDLVGSTALSAKLDPEELSQLMQSYRKACTDVIARYDGHVAQYLGDGVMVYFGWPKAHEDDAQRTVRAGLDIIEAVAGLKASERLDVRIGVATGLVVVGESGADEGADAKLAVGETPNLAARVQGSAQPGTLAIAQSTRRLIGGAFALEDLGSQAFKGIDGETTVYRVTGESAAESRFDAAHGVGLTPFVGRDSEIALLAERWAQAKGGEGQVVLLEGEPGIGKSRISGTFRERIATEPHFRTLHQCSPFHANSAFHPITEQLERAAGFDSADDDDARLDKLEALIGSDEATTLALLAALLSLPSERYPALNMNPQKQKERTIEALVAETAKLAETQPLYMLFEDAHWIDPSTQEVLDQIIPAIESLPVLLVITFRPEFTPPWSHGHVSHARLNRLGKSPSATMIDRVADGKPLPKEVTDQIVAKTDGVPLFIEELTKAVLESDLLIDTGNRYELSGSVDQLAIPATLRDSLMARLDKLLLVKEIAQIGACIGREFSHELLAAVSPLHDNELGQALQQLVDSELVFRRGTSLEATYTFKHALVQDTAYESLLKSKRQRLHTMIAKVIDDRFPVVKDTKPELLAHHFTAARMADMAVPLWLKAGELSLARYAHPEALEHLKTGLALIPELSESIERDRTELAFHMAMASSHNATSGWASDETKAAYDGAKAIMDRIGADESQFDMLIGMFYFYNVRGFHDDAVPLIEEALRLLDAAGTDARRLVGYQAYGQSNLWRGHFTRSAEYFEKSMSVYDEEEHLALAQVWGADFYATDLTFLGMSYWALGFPERAWAASQGAFEHARHLDRPLVLAWVGGTATYGLLLQERFDEAIARSVECQKLARELDFHIMDASATLAEGCARIGLGDHDDGIRILQRGIEAWSGFGAQVHVPHARGFLAMGYAATGCYDDALTQIDLGLGESRDGGEHWSDAELFRRHGDVQRMMGRSDEAASSFQHALEVARRQEAKGMELRAATSLVRLWCEQGERQKARDLLAPIYDWFTEGFDTKNLKDAKALLDELK